jgi:hypothetical protein
VSIRPPSHLLCLTLISNSLPACLFSLTHKYFLHLPLSLSPSSHPSTLLSNLPYYSTRKKKTPSPYTNVPMYNPYLHRKDLRHHPCMYCMHIPCLAFLFSPPTPRLMHPINQDLTRAAPSKITTSSNPNPSPRHTRLFLLFANIVSI